MLLHIHDDAAIHRHRPCCHPRSPPPLSSPLQCSSGRLFGDQHFFLVDSDGIQILLLISTTTVLLPLLLFILSYIILSIIIIIMIYSILIIHTLLLFSIITYICLSLLASFTDRSITLLFIMDHSLLTETRSGHHHKDFF